MNLKDRVTTLMDTPSNDIIVEIEASRFTPGHMAYIMTLSEILANDTELNGIEPEEFELDIFEITINNLQTYEEELIKCER